MGTDQEGGALEAAGRQQQEPGPGIRAWAARPASPRLATELPNPLLHLGLDEMPNIAPLGNLPQIIMQGGDQGVRVTWLAQNFQSVVDRYGLARAKTMWNATNAGVIFGGLKDDEWPGGISKLIGEREVESTTRTGPDRLWGGGRGQVTTGKAMQPITSVKQLRELPVGKGVLLYRHHPPMLLDFPPPEEVPSLRRLMPAMSSSPSTAAAQQVH